MDQKTNIQEVIGGEPDSLVEEDDTELYIDSDPLKIVTDLSISLKTRLNAIEKCSKNPEIEMADILNRIGTMFIFSEAKMIESYLYNIVANTDISPLDKLLASRNLKTYSIKGYDCYDILCQNTELHISIRVDSMFILLEEESPYKSRGMQYIETFFNNSAVDGYYRYKTITSKYEMLGDDLKVLLVNFIANPKNPSVFKILSSQYLLIHYPEDPGLRNNAQAYLLGIIDNPQQDYNTRADATDVLLQYGDQDSKTLAQTVLEDLALGGLQVARTIFENAQNVHSKSIEDSVNKVLCQLNNSVDTKTTFEISLGEFIEYLDLSEEFKDNPHIRLALQRITVDKAVYGMVNMSLSSIFSKIWSYIKGHQHRQELLVRLCQELQDSDQLCSTGYISRMLNSLSGITELSISISYEDQIISNMGARLNTLIMNHPQEDHRDLILEEMMLPSHMYDRRSNFLKFFRDNISAIRQSLYQEFQGLLDDVDYDLYTRRAIMKYQGDF